MHQILAPQLPCLCAARGNVFENGPTLPCPAIANGGRSFTGRALFCFYPSGRLRIILCAQSLALHSTDTLTQYTTTSLGCWIQRKMHTGEYVHGKGKNILS